MPPQSITMFSRLFLGSLALGTVNYALNYENAIGQLQADPAAAQLGTAGAGIMIATFVFSMAISLLLWFFIARRASNAARWILTVFTVIGVLSLPLSIGKLPVPVMLVALAITGLQVAALWFAFRPDAKAWFKHGPKGMDADVFE